jgi:hypothetical protein
VAESLSNQRRGSRPRPLGFSNVVSNTWGGRKRWAREEGEERSRAGGGPREGASARREEN